MIPLKTHSQIALTYFLFIAFLGVFLRLFQLVDFPANYKYLVHTHSHLALLGWLYTGLTTLIYKLYLVDVSIEKKYRLLFWVTQLTVIGMLVTFPFTGYALFSIIFSTLFLIASYIFTWIFFRYTSKAQKQTSSYKCICIALWYMVISSIGPWALGYIMNTVGSSSNLYRNAIYFYLHFQYNGWFIMALFGIFFYAVEQQNIPISKKMFNSFFWLINVGVVASFAISLLWMQPHVVVYLLAGLGALFQLLAFGVLIKELLLFRKKIANRSSKLSFLALRLLVLFFLIKLVLQLLGSTPYFSTIISSNIDFIIGYLHWTFLGVVSIALLWFLYYFKLIQLTNKTLLFYLVGFILTEGLIFYKGFVIWQKLPLIDNYFTYLVIASCTFLIAIASIYSLQFRRIKN